MQTSNNTHRKPFEHKKKGQQNRKLDAHEMRLIRAKREGHQMRFNTTDGRVYGVVVGFDKFSVIVKEKSSGEDIVLFKHSINSFTVSEHARVAA
ncbi:TPA: RNA chaperone Hfq [Vibrio alginolyticus]|nr:MULTISPECIES: RNA chaperone Hfq [Vibrio harveyi group]EJL8716080.1 RNA chaperone Hfq [Vibrio alginolyticus]KLI71184.1 hypothetical protein AAW26_16845 [Vibrio alginolyticus]MBS9810589.1 RNA chaperone Hfq [Vibrio alginolyticus]MCQ9070844.1 RNA chaperone Hfq [Vibrio alginolyticus]MCR9484074.1 RNA chaperone Hfq [Vibrio alginolyticus]